MDLLQGNCSNVVAGHFLFLLIFTNHFSSKPGPVTASDSESAVSDKLSNLFPALTVSR